jgi:predicted nucleic acid-binding protein
VKRVFGDSLFFIALLNERDHYHAKARGLAMADALDIVTTRWVLAEVANALSTPPWRQRAAVLLDRSKSSARLRVIEESDRLFDQGTDLYRRRSDKGWSLTDCISFVVMADEGLTEALTGDRHFEQAGFMALLAPHVS